MPRITEEPLEAIQLRLFKKDLDFLRRTYKGSVGVNKALRAIIRSYVTQVEAKANAVIDEAERSELELLESEV